MSTLGERIKYAREEKGLLQGELAKLIGVKSSGVISNWEKDLNKPDAEKIVKLCDVLNVSASYLLDYYGKTSFEVNPQEFKLIKKYRSLDSYGQETVNYMMNRESGRAEQIAELEQQNIDADMQKKIDEEVEDYRRQVELEVSQADGSAASQSGRRKEA